MAVTCEACHMFTFPCHNVSTVNVRGGLSHTEIKGSCLRIEIMANIGLYMNDVENLSKTCILYKGQQGATPFVFFFFFPPFPDGFLVSVISLTI